MPLPTAPLESSLTALLESRQVAGPRRERRAVIGRRVPVAERWCSTVAGCWCFEGSRCPGSVAPTSAGEEQQRARLELKDGTPFGDKKNKKQHATIRQKSSLVCEHGTPFQKEVCAQKTPRQKLLSSGVCSYPRAEIIHPCFRFCASTWSAQSTKPQQPRDARRPERTSLFPCCAVDISRSGGGAADSSAEAPLGCCGAPVTPPLGRGTASGTAVAGACGRRRGRGEGAQVVSAALSMD